MKKIYVIFSLLLVAVLLFILLSHDKNKIKSIDGNSRYILGEGCYDEKGMLFFKDDRMLTFVDADSGEEAFVCSNANCPHTYNRNSDTLCAAASLDGSDVCLMSEDKIYVIGNFKDKKAGIDTLGIYEENLDGTDIKKLTSIKSPETVPQLIHYAELKDDKIIFYYSNSLDISDEDSPAQYDITLYGFGVFDIATNEVFCVNVPAYEDENLNGAWISGVFLENNHVFYTVVYTFGSDKNLLRLYDYDIENKTEVIKAEFEDKHPVAFNGSAMILSNLKCDDEYKNDKYFYDINKKTETFLLNGGVGTAFSCENMFLFSVPDFDREVSRWYACELDGSFREIGELKFNEYVSTVNKSDVWLVDFYEDDSGSVIYKINTEDFKNGKFDKRKKVYERHN